MARDGSVRLHFGDGEHLFRLRIGDMLELQDRINSFRLPLLIRSGHPNPPLIGPATLVRECGVGNLWPHELREIMRLGLVGGGMRASNIEVLLARHFNNYSITELSLKTFEVLKAAFLDDDTPAGKD